MNTKSVRLVYFSPTKTTKVILENIAGEICPDAVVHVDATSPNIGPRVYSEMSSDDLLIIGAPVYAGRIPPIAVQRFQGMKSEGNPAVIVVLYGNREFEDALLELSDLAAEAGFVPVAGGAFIGEHSFSSESKPLSQGRPDTSDIQQARRFGASVAQLLQSIQNIQEVGSLELPGNRPLIEHDRLPKISPATERDRCIACGACAAACPTNSISINEISSSNAETCILCCACVRACPAGARSLKDPNIAGIIEWLQGMTRKRKEPQVFLCRKNP